MVALNIGGSGVAEVTCDTRNLGCGVSGWYGVVVGGVLAGSVLGWGG